MRYGALHKQHKVTLLDSPLSLPVMVVNTADGKTYYLDMVTLPGASSPSLIYAKKNSAYNYTLVPVTTDANALQFFSTSTTQFVWIIGISSTKVDEGLMIIHHP